MASQDILNGMRNAAPDQVINLENNIQAISDQVDGLQAEAAAIEDGILDVDATALLIYLDSTKVEEFQLINPAATLEIGPDYNVINITDWRIFDSTSSDTIYEYAGVGWDGDPLITQLVTDWAFGYDYLTRPLVSGATYGIYPQIAALISAKSLLETNQAKIDASIDIFERYI